MVHELFMPTPKQSSKTHTVIRSTPAHNTLAGTEYSVSERTTYTKPSHTRSWPVAGTHCVAWGGCSICDVHIRLDACARRRGFARIAAHM